MKFDPDKVTWREPSDITMIACMVDDGIENTEEQYNNFLKAEDKPHVLDDETVNRALKLAEEDSVFIEVYEEQIKQWRKGTLTTLQENKVNRISQELEKYRNLHEKYFALVKKISEQTIDKIMDMDDAELALKVLSGELPDPLK